MVKSYYGEKISGIFQRFARKAGIPEKQAQNKTPENYSYLQSNDPQVIAAHGLSLMFRAYNENPIFQTERCRRAAEILYEVHGNGNNNDIGNNHLVAALLLQDVVHFRPADKNSREATHLDVTNKLFDGNVMTWANDYKKSVEKTDAAEQFKDALPGTKCMKLATLIEYLEHNLEQTKQSTDYFDRRVKEETGGVVVTAEELIKTIKNKRLEHLTHTEGLLEHLQREFKVIQGIDENMDTMFQKKMQEFRNHIETWKIDNGFTADEKRYPPRLPPGSVRI